MVEEVPGGVMIDTLAYVRQVTRAGVPREQAEAMAEALKAALQDEVPKKRDIVALRVQVAINTTLLVPILGKLLFF
jgi:hypothetical protein